MDHTQVARYFTRSDGSYLFARWGRPIAPVVFGVDDATLSIIKGAIEAVVVLADHKMAQTDPELGANLVIFFFQEWSELLDTPDLDRLVPDLAEMVQTLDAKGANQYRLFRFDEAGAIKAVFAFVKMDTEMAQVPAEDIALAQAAQSMVLWSDTAFQDHGTLAKVGDHVVLHPDVAALIRASYARSLPDVERDPSHAMRVAARIGAMQ